MRRLITSLPKLPLYVYRWAFGACVLSVLVLALAPLGPEAPTTGWDKTNHLLAFSIMAVLGSRSFPSNVHGVLVVLLAYGGVIECLQYLTPYRSAEWSDVLADALGLALGWLLVRLGSLASRGDHGATPRLLP